MDSAARLVEGARCVAVRHVRGLARTAKASSSEKSTASQCGRRSRPSRLQHERAPRGRRSPIESPQHVSGRTLSKEMIGCRQYLCATQGAWSRQCTEWEVHGVGVQHDRLQAALERDREDERHEHRAQEVEGRADDADGADRLREGAYALLNPSLLVRAAAEKGHAVCARGCSSITTPPSRTSAESCCRLAWAPSYDTPLLGRARKRRPYTQWGRDVL